jgi:mono/diheme cytochrome c family protein
MGSVPASVRRLLVVSAIFALTLCLCIADAGAEKRAGKAKDGDAWEVPARAGRKKNPLAADRTSVAAGRKVWVAECADCHGNRGAGDGPGARDLKTRVPDLAAAAVWRQTDGALFYKLSTGRGDMPGFDDMLSEEERWHVLNYARATFAPRGAGAARDPSQRPDGANDEGQAASGRERGK